MIEINETALTALAGFAGMFYLWFEGLFKPGVHKIAYLIRDRYYPIVVPLGEEPDDVQKESDLKVDEYAFTVFRLSAIFGGILFVAVTDIGTSYFEVFGLIAADNMQWLVVVTTGIAIGLGNKGTHWFVDLGRDVLTMAMKWFQIRVPE